MGSHNFTVTGLLHRVGSSPKLNYLPWFLCKELDVGVEEFKTLTMFL